VKETKRQGRIAHHHTDATVPHIVALLGSTFHVAKIDIIPDFCKLLQRFFLVSNKIRDFASAPCGYDAIHRRPLMGGKRLRMVQRRKKKGDFDRRHEIFTDLFGRMGKNA